jgi:hypothetical protein
MLLQTPAVAAAVFLQPPVQVARAVKAAPASSSFVTQALSVALAARSLHPAATPFTPSLHLALTRHKEKLMSHFAKVNNGIVEQVIVAEPEFFDTFVDSSPGQWIQTSYNTRGGKHYDPETGELSADQTKALRKNYAGIGFTYDAAKDAFIPPKPFNSWLLDEDTCLWNAPVAYPDDGGRYVWNEETISWDAVPEAGE